jgi:hypothetical protein
VVAISLLPGHLYRTSIQKIPPLRSASVELQFLFDLEAHHSIGGIWLEVFRS